MKPPAALLRVLRFVTGPLETNTYLVLSPDGAGAVLVDPAGPSPRLAAMLEDGRIAVDRILLTHGHFDHFGGVPEFRRLVRGGLWIHRDDGPLLDDAFLNGSFLVGGTPAAGPADGFLEDGMEIPVGGGALRVLHTPGHSPGGVSFAGPGFVVSGDALFRGSIGRTDLPGSSTETLLRAVRTKLLALPDETEVFPGHGPFTTIGHEKRRNPFLRDAQDAA